MFLFLAIVVQAWNIQREHRHDAEGHLHGDSGLYAAATHSMLYDGDLDLLNQWMPQADNLDAVLPWLEGEHGGEFALSKHRSITLKQSPLLSAAALPVYAMMGKKGLLIFNLLMLNTMLILMAFLGGSSSLSRLVVLIGFGTTPLWRYAFNFSPDIFLCVLILGAIVAARQRHPIVSGLIAGLAVSTKIYVAAILLPLPLIVWAVHDTRIIHALAKLILGGIIGMVPGMIFNIWQFSHPLINGYARQLKVEHGIIATSDHVSLFNVPFLQGMHNILLHESLGLLWTAPLWFLWPIAFATLLLPRRTPDKKEVVALGLMIVATLLLFIPYAGWDATVHGNRYLFPAVTLGIVLIAKTLHLRFASNPHNLPM